MPPPTPGSAKAISVVNTFKVSVHHHHSLDNENKNIASGAIYTRSPILEKILIGIPYSPVKWRDNRAKVDKILFILSIQYKSLHMVLGSGDSDETGWKPGLLIFSSPVIFSSLFGLCLEEVDTVRRRAERDKISRTILEAINTLYSI